MRLRLAPLALLFGCLAACASGADEEADGTGQNLTGGGTSVESPIVFLFDGADTTLTPKCSGALLADKLAVTARSCAKVGLTVGRADEDDGKGKRTTVKAVHLPERAGSEIAVVELAASIGGQPAVVTHAPLRDGYSIQSWSSKDQSGLFKADQGEASSIGGRLTSETATQSTVVPAKGTMICASDMGAPVCSSTATTILGAEVRGTCGLAGLVVGAPDGATSLTSKANGGCSDGAWKVATLGQDAEFLAKLAPKAFQPIAFESWALRWLPSYVADGLWGYESAGDVKTCQITTANLTAVPVSGLAKVSAKVSFANMQARAQAYGRFGIAPKGKPDQITWWPAKTTTTGKGDAFDATFEGTVGASVDGEYIVAFRASGSGGERWTVCDTTGIAATVTAAKTLSLLVGDPAKAPAPTTPTGTSTTTAATTPPAAGATDGEDYADAKSELPATESAVPQPVAKPSAGGCSAAGGNVPGSSLGLAGLGLAVAAVVRRRRR